MFRYPTFSHTHTHTHTLQLRWEYIPAQKHGFFSHLFLPVCERLIGVCSPSLFFFFFFFFSSSSLCFFCCRYASREWFNNSAASFFMPRLFLHTTLTCNIDSHTHTHTHTHPLVCNVTQTPTQTLTSLHGPQRKHDVTTLSFLLFSVYLANYSPLFFSSPTLSTRCFFFCCFFLSFSSSLVYLQ